MRDGQPENIDNWNRVMMMNWTKEQLIDELIEQGTRPRAKLMIW
jgi:hypothetical protein